MIVCGSFQRLRGVTIRGTLRAGWLGSWLVESVVGERDWSNAGCRSLARPLGQTAMRLRRAYKLKQDGGRRG
ncbi:PREDICTED: uncharacterized protein LOC105154645 isoform X3 [Acromyrmex echinatior]|uniref:uncharacterized protein LOC105154645 isoform X3 n=1 Tax=Acromyrmex echinatior TaxID=103372 RepID=UPI0005810DDF|nr:PREDICTED: uncharacterized protein LOC105154645 isoform X3 [Acromyrmex echinatior]